MESKYRMTREQNIFATKRNIVDYIWKSAKLEGLGVTYPDTYSIFNGMGVEGVPVKEIIAVNNLKHAWQFVLDNLDYPIDYPFICKINQYVGGDSLIANSGFLRNVPVSIGGTGWKPDMPIESQVKERLADIQQIGGATERAIALMLYCMRAQLFLDGNKRTGMLAGNHVMIASGAGILSVPVEMQGHFMRLLLEYYESGDMEKISGFIYEQCIDGMDFPPPVPEEQRAELERHSRRWKEPER